MLNFETLEPKNPATACVIFLHGLGANGFDLMETVPLLGLPDAHSIRFVFPHAPSLPVTINGGMTIPAWYDITGLTLDSRQDFTGLEQSRHAINQLIEQEIARGIKPERIILGGFSQGGAVTLFTGLQSAHRLAGLIVLSSYFPCIEQTTPRLTSISRQIPILMAHGTEDPVVMFQWGEFSKAALLAIGCQLQWHQYPIGHEICLPELLVMKQFIQQQLGF